ncbi:MAG: hypothetical protein RLZZ223_385 [Candidatus Parcubacteria bacterium]
MKKFIRQQEDFICINCGHSVIGNGYTNHCSKCLYSVHVDINPGDRQSECYGLMKPVDVITKGGQPLDLVYQCQKCKIIKNNIINNLDSIETIIAIMRDKVKREMLR